LKGGDIYGVEHLIENADEIAQNFDFKGLLECDFDLVEEIEGIPLVEREDDEREETFEEFMFRIEGQVDQERNGNFKIQEETNQEKTKQERPSELPSDWMFEEYLQNYEF
jgi:hypothetical protein